MVAIACTTLWGMSQYIILVNQTLGMNYKNCHSHWIKSLRIMLSQLANQKWSIDVTIDQLNIEYEAN